jgi:Ser/Thr protein kinase RdoA (MazF antagonist)
MVSDNLLSFASNSYGFDKGTLNFISESTNQIYTFNKGNKRYILRFSQRPSEQIHQVKAEMDWLYYLAKNKIGVSLPLSADNNELVLSTKDEGKPFIISVFEALPGKFWDKNNPDLWNEKIFFNWGKVTGGIHRLTKNYLPANDTDARSTFTGHEALSIDTIKPCSAVHKIAENLISEIMAFPKDKDSYGLIHYDIHPWNFIIDGEQINVFDFDDSLYGWFALDIGVALYHGLWWGRKNDAGHDFTNEIIKSFLDGYLSANPLSDFWISKIPVFMRFRQICKLSWFYSPDNEDDHQKERIRNIENNILFTGCEINRCLFKR